MEHGADINWQSDYDGYTAFLVACYHGNEEIGSYLLQNGAAAAECMPFRGAGPDR